MLISLNWIRDFVDLPEDLDARALAERFTLTTAEVEEVKQINISARGIIVARILELGELPGASNVRRAVLDVGKGEKLETVTAAPDLRVGDNVVYAPPGSHVASIGDISTTQVAGVTSSGMILPGQALGVEALVAEALFVSDAMAPGEPVSPGLFDDWLIEVDNKSITNRPDLWGHYGVAREIAAIAGCALKPYPVVPLKELDRQKLPTIPILIADPDACPRYCGILLEGVPAEPAPLWMQLRLGCVGMRPINALVDLTNYVMADLGQPMHAFDAARVDRIEVAWARDGERFKTLDGVERSLTSSALMIQRGGKSIALAGLMGGEETEVTEKTTSLLLESANFNAAVIRTTAGRLGLRTDASARFEKSLDPAHARLAIQRFIHLARKIYPKLSVTSRLSDAFPKPPPAVSVRVSPRHVTRTIGREVTFDEAVRRLAPLGFEIASGEAGWNVRVPSFRAANDVSMEADVVEEIARCMGYGAIEPSLPRITMRRFEPNALHELERKTLEYLTTSQRFNEIHGYLWYDTAWLAQIGFEPGECLELANPSAEGLHRLRRTLMPGMLEAVAKNRFYFPALRIIELGSVFAEEGDEYEFRHIALVRAKRGKGAEEEVYKRLKGDLEGWAWRCFARPVEFLAAEPEGDLPWRHPRRTARVVIDGRTVGHVSVINATLRRAMDEHLVAWAVAWAELRLSGLEGLRPAREPLGTVPAFPLVNMDFSFVVPASARYTDISEKLVAFTHPLLKQIRYQGSYEGKSVGSGKRSVTVRTVCGHDERTLVDVDLAGFRSDFERYLRDSGYEIRG